MAPSARFGWRGEMFPTTQQRRRAYNSVRLDRKIRTILQQPSTDHRRLIDSSWSMPSRPSRIQRTSTGTKFLIFIVTILTAQNIRLGYFGLVWRGGEAGFGVGVQAEPCTVTTNASLEAGMTVGELKEVTVSNDTSNLSTMFACEDGAFDVFWSGVVQVPTTIKIGRGTTVRIFGDNISVKARTNSSANTIASINGSTSDTSNINSSSSSSSGVDLELELQRLSAGLNLPHELTSAAVRVDGDVPFGPIFFVDAGALHLEGVAIRGGNSTNSTANTILLGGGIYANSSNVSISGCTFEDNFAKLSGGGIHADWSTLTVRDSVFRRNKAGFQSFAGEEDIEGAGGGIASEYTRMHFDGCLFDDNYASKKGGGVHMGRGQVSVVNSLFYNNLAGSNNVESEDSWGEGAAFSFTVCTQSFDGLSPCGVNDSTFIYNAAAKKGGTIAVGSGIGPSYIEFHRCLIDNSTTGWPFKDDPQGEGGAFSLGENTTLVLEDCVVTNNYCGKKGGAVTLSGGDSWGKPGGTIIVRNSTFAGNFAELDSAGAIYLGKFATAHFEGDMNNFTGNVCGDYGGVLAAASNTNVTVKGGWFEGNKAGEGGGAFWTKGTLIITGGNFTANYASENGGVLFASEESFLTLYDGRFEGNGALNGGVVYADESSVLAVRGGIYSGNKATNGGGAFWGNDGGDIEITGGIFNENAADFGGFLYVEGRGTTSCTGASVVGHSGVDGGAVYAVDGAVLDWECDLIDNKALVGPAMYARDDANITIHGAILSNNTIARGSVVFVISSSLQTYQVVFNDTTSSPDLSAVQCDVGSTYVAEETAFVGFEGEAVVYSEGTLYLDDCDFSSSSASMLVYSDPGSSAVIRNTVLGDNNFESVIQDAFEASDFPVNGTLINVALTCSESGSPCSLGSICLEGELGVYCQCYHRFSTSEETCLDGHSKGLLLSEKKSPPITFYPSLLEGDLVVGLDDDGSRAFSTSTISPMMTSNRSILGGVVWNASAIFHELISWTLFPSVGLLYPGRNITVRVVSSPDARLDGTITAMFAAEGIGTPEESFHATSSGLTQGKVKEDVHASATLDYSSGSGVSVRQDMSITFFHCRPGNFWNLSIPSNGHAASCDLCSSIEEGDIKGLDCSAPGASTLKLPIRSGYWRASLNSITIRECFNKGACVGGNTAGSVEEYCGIGYEGPYCAVCSSGYGDGSGNSCHKCTAEFQGVMYFLFALAILTTFIVFLLLGIYLVGGKVAISHTVLATKESARNLHRRGSELFLGSESRGRKDMSVSTFVSSDNSQAGLSAPLASRKRSAAATKIIEARLGGLGVSSGGCSSKTGNGSFPKRGDRVNEKPGLASAISPIPARKVDPPPESASVDSRGVDSSRVPHPSPFEKRGSGGCEETIAPAQNCSNHGDGYMKDAVHEHNRERKKESGGGKRYAKKNEEKKKTTAAVIGGVFGTLPLSKLKIVIVVWQISRAFTEITDVPFPEVYDNFLSFIGIFSLDLGWIMSAACLTVGLDFYDKLLIVTIGPVFLLGLLCITFYVGARPDTSTHSNRLNAKIRSAGAAETFTASSTDRMPGNELDWARKTKQQKRASQSRVVRVIATLFASSGLSAVTRRGSRRHNHRHNSSVTSLVTSQACESGMLRTALEDTPTLDGPRNVISDLVASRNVENGTRSREGKEGAKKHASRQSARQGVLSQQRSVRRILKDGPGVEVDRDRNHLWRLFARHTTMTLIILYLVYSQVSTVVFQTFMCEDLDDIGKSYLRADFRIECDTSKHGAYKIYAAIMICVYPVGIPIAFWYVLVLQRLRINPAIDKNTKDKRGACCLMAEKAKKRMDDPIVAPTSFLWAAYYPNRYYFEVCECLRRLLLTGLLVFVVPNTPGQVAYSCLFAFISLIGFELLRPHMDRLERMLYRTGCLVIFFTNFLGLMIKAKVADPDSKGAAMYSVVLIIVNILFFCSIWGNTLATIKATFSRRHVQGVMLGVDILGEDKIDSLMPEVNEEGGVERNKTGGEAKIEDVQVSSNWDRDNSAMEEDIGTKSSRSYDRSVENYSPTEAIIIPPPFFKPVSAEEENLSASRSMRGLHFLRRDGGASVARSTTLRNITAAVTTGNTVFECGPKSRGFPYALTGSAGLHLVRNPAQSPSTDGSPCQISKLEIQP